MELAISWPPGSCVQGQGAHPPLLTIPCLLTPPPLLCRAKVLILADKKAMFQQLSRVLGPANVRPPGGEGVGGGL